MLGRPEKRTSKSNDTAVNRCCRDNVCGNCAASLGDSVRRAKNQVMAAIRDFRVDATEMNSDILTIATSRPQGYSNEFSPEFYIHKFLTPLSAKTSMPSFREKSKEDNHNQVFCFARSRNLF